MVGTFICGASLRVDEAAIVAVGLVVAPDVAAGGGFFLFGRRFRCGVCVDDVGATATVVDDEDCAVASAVVGIDGKDKDAMLLCKTSYCTMNIAMTQFSDAGLGSIHHSSEFFVLCWELGFRSLSKLECLASYIITAEH